MKKTCNHCVACEFIEFLKPKNYKFYCHQANANLENLRDAEKCQCYEAVKEADEKI